MEFKKKVEVKEISRFFDEPSFRTKKMIYLPISNKGSVFDM